MLRPIDHFFLHTEEPSRSCLQFLRTFILQQDDQITEAWKYGMPFYCYAGKMFCYLWVDRKNKQPYIGIVEGKRIRHSGLIKGKRSRMKIYPLNPNDDIPVAEITKLMREVIALYKTEI